MCDLGSYNVYSCVLGEVTRISTCALLGLERVGKYIEGSCVGFPGFLGKLDCFGLCIGSVERVKNQDDALDTGVRE